MKKTLLRILLVICGLNVFTACYGVPPDGYWPEPESLPDSLEQTKASLESAEDSIPEESGKTDVSSLNPTDEIGDTTIDE